MTDEINTPYDHSQDKPHLACGISEDRFKDLQSLSFELYKKAMTISEIAENLEKAVSRRELAYMSAFFLSEKFETFQDVEEAIVASLGIHVRPPRTIEECGDCKKKDTCKQYQKMKEQMSHLSNHTK